VPDWTTVHQDLKRKGVTKQLLWEEYSALYPNRCYSYSQYCDRFRHWQKQQKRSMRQIHKAGEKCFIDYCGPTVPIINPQTGEIRTAQVFVAVLGASNYTYAEATWSQVLQDWLMSHVRTLPGNRKEAFKTLDQPALRALPKHPYEYVEIRRCRVNIDYHIEFQQHHYSVPHQYVGEQVDIHASERLVQIYFRQRQIASHPRSHQYGMTTESGHMPTRHQKQQQWSPGRLKNWARDIGPDTLIWVSDRLDEREHPEQAYRVCLGLLNLSKEYPSERLNAGCRIANREGLDRLKHIKAILRSNRDKLPEQLPLHTELPQHHENIRGPKSFH
jgi:hypothetical protein